MDFRFMRGLLAACTAALIPAFAAAQSPPPLFVFAQESFNPSTGHYLVTLSEAEVRGLPSGWTPTSYWFFPYAPSTTDPMAANVVPVCQFDLGSPAVSRLFTADAAECDFLKTHDTGWTYKGIAFCGRFAQRDTVAFEVLMGSFPPSTACGAGAKGQSCIALTALPDMGQQIGMNLGNNNATDPLYTPAFAAKTGRMPERDLVYSASLAGAPAERSFVEWFYGSQVIGIHVVGADRRYGDYATISPTLHYGSDPAYGTRPNGPAVAPWPDRGAHDVIVNFQLKIATVWRTDDASQAYGGPVIDFLDVKSGSHLLLRALAYSSQAPGDFTGIDPVTGFAMDSTTWAKPRFGRALQVEFIACPSATLATGGCAARGIDYSFRIDRDDFTAALTRARSVAPALSADVADYVVTNAQLRNETLGDAELGLLENALQFIVTK